MTMRFLQELNRTGARRFGSKAKMSALVLSAAAPMLLAVACTSNSTTTTPPQQQQSAPAPMASLGAQSLPDQTSVSLPAFPAYYDAHKDVVTVTDAFPKLAATQYHVNYAPSLGAVTPASQPLWYVIKGPAAAGQITVLGSEPGESDYSPLWRTVFVTWKSGMTPKVLTSDNMILNLAKKHDLTVKYSNQLVNATVISVGS